jgi:hypothetical protein
MKTYICDLCKKMFKQKSNYLAHTTYKKNPCVQINFNSSLYYQEELKLNTNNSVITTQSNTHKSTLDNTVLNNSVTNTHKSTLNNSTLNNSVLNNSVLNNSVLNNSVLNNSVLNKSVLSNSALNNSVPNNKCNNCGYSTIRIDNFKRHLNICKIKTLLCDNDNNDINDTDIVESDDIYKIENELLKTQIINIKKENELLKKDIYKINIIIDHFLTTNTTNTIYNIVNSINNQIEQDDIQEQGQGQGQVQTQIDAQIQTESQVKAKAQIQAKAQKVQEVQEVQEVQKVEKVEKIQVVQTQIVPSIDSIYNNVLKLINDEIDKNKIETRVNKSELLGCDILDFEFEIINKLQDKMEINNYGLWKLVFDSKYNCKTNTHKYFHNDNLIAIWTK